MTRWTFCVECGRNFATVDPEQYACGETCLLAYVGRQQAVIAKAIKDFEQDEQADVTERFSAKRHPRFDLV